MSDYYDHDGREGEDIFGTPVVATEDFTLGLDFEWLILGMEPDHAKIVLVRHFGLRGKKAARACGFSSEWSLYRREHELKKLLSRQREHFIG